MTSPRRESISKTIPSMLQVDKLIPFKLVLNNSLFSRSVSTKSIFFNWTSTKTLSFRRDFLNFIKSTYIYKYINHEYAQNYVYNPKNAEKITDITLLYFTKTREILEKRWGKKVNFTIIYYDTWPIPHGELLKKKFEDKGFNVIKTSELTSENLENEKYLSKVNSHPTEEAWNLLTPLIIKKLNLN